MCFLFKKSFVHSSAFILTFWHVDYHIKWISLEWLNFFIMWIKYLFHWFNIVLLVNKPNCHHYILPSCFTVESLVLLLTYVFPQSASKCILDKQGDAPIGHKPVRYGTLSTGLSYFHRHCLRSPWTHIFPQAAMLSFSSPLLCPKSSL